MVLRERIDGEIWEKVFEDTEHGQIRFDDKEEIAIEIKKHFEEMTGVDANKCLLTQNFGKWAQAAQKFWFSKCGEEETLIKKHMGELPKVVTKQVIKAKT